MTGQEFINIYRNGIRDSYMLSELIEKGEVEWFARAIRTASTFNGDVEIVRTWSDWFITRGIPWAVVDAKIGISLYKEPFYDKKIYKSVQSCAKTSNFG